MWLFHSAFPLIPNRFALFAPTLCYPCSIWLLLSHVRNHSLQLCWPHFILNLLSGHCNKAKDNYCVEWNSKKAQSLFLFGCLCLFFWHSCGCRSRKTGEVFLIAAMWYRLYYASFSKASSLEPACESRQWDQNAGDDHELSVSQQLLTQLMV